MPAAGGSSSTQSKKQRTGFKTSRRMRMTRKLELIQKKNKMKSRKRKRNIRSHSRK